MNISDYAVQLRAKNKALQTLVYNLLVTISQGDFSNGLTLGDLYLGDMGVAELISELQQQAIALGVSYTPGSAIFEMKMPQQTLHSELETIFNKYNFDTKLNIPDYAIATIAIEFLTSLVSLRVEQMKHNAEIYAPTVFDYEVDQSGNTRLGQFDLTELIEIKIPESTNFKIHDLNPSVIEPLIDSDTGNTGLTHKVYQNDGSTIYVWDGWVDDNVKPQDSDRTQAFTLDELFGDNVEPQ